MVGLVGVTGSATAGQHPCICALFFALKHLCCAVHPPPPSLLQIMSLMYQPPLAPTPSLVFSLVRIKSGMTGEAVIWMDSAGSTQTSMPAAFAGVDVATVFRGIGEWSPVTCFFFFLVRRSHSIIFTRAQGIPKYKIGFGRGRVWESWDGLVEGVSSPCGLVVCNFFSCCTYA